jgi:hypothetical protein
VAFNECRTDQFTSQDQLKWRPDPNKHLTDDELNEIKRMVPASLMRGKLADALK